jgi:hypothetical protein
MRRADERDVDALDVRLPAELEIGAQPWQMCVRGLAGELL